MNIKFNYKLSFNTIKRKEFVKNKKTFHKKLFLCKNRLKMIKNIDLFDKDAPSPE